MAQTNCFPCQEYTCLCDVQECAGYLNIGKAPLANTVYYVHIYKAISDMEYIHAATSAPDKTLMIPLSVPNVEWYNHFDSLYQVKVVRPIDSYYFCDCSDEVITTPTGTYTIGAFKFRKCSGVQMNQVSLTVLEC